MPVNANLKRKLEYKNCHIQQIINPTNIYKFLHFLKESGHPSYQFFNWQSFFEQRCKEDDPSGFCLLYPEYENIETPSNQGSENVIDEIQNEDTEGEPYEVNGEEAEQEEEEYRTKDPAKKQHFQYDKSTSMVPKFPEAGVSNTETLSFAPGEGKIPTNILKEKDWDSNSFPHLFPSGKNKMFQERKVQLTPQAFVGQRYKIRTVHPLRVCLCSTSGRKTNGEEYWSFILQR